MAMMRSGDLQGNEEISEDSRTWRGMSSHPELNKVLGTKAPAHDLEAMLPTDPYIDGDGDGFAPGPSYGASGITEILFFLKDADDANPAVGAQLPADLWDSLSDAMLEEVLGISSIRRLALELGIADPN
jgi:hypothetical protein